MTSLKAVEATKTKTQVTTVSLVCIKVGSMLRVRITSPGYHKDANCQCPRNIRKPGLRYEVPSDGITLAKGPRGKFFYRISKSQIKILNEGDTLSHKIEKLDIKVYGDDESECVVCFENDKTIVFAPCGHYCTCKSCSDAIVNKNNECPMCRTIIKIAVSRDQVG